MKPLYQDYNEAVMKDLQAYHIHHNTKKGKVTMKVNLTVKVKMMLALLVIILSQLACNNLEVLDIAGKVYDTSPSVKCHDNNIWGDTGMCH